MHISLSSLNHELNRVSESALLIGFFSDEASVCLCSYFLQVNELKKTHRADILDLLRKQLTEQLELYKKHLEPV